MGLKRDLLETSAFYSFNLLISKIFLVFSFWILVQTVPSSSIAIVGIVSGIIVFYQFINFNLVRSFYQNFHSAMDRLNEYVSACLIFAVLDALLISFIAAILSAGIWFFSGNAFLTLFLMGMSIVFALDALVQNFQELFYVLFKQDIVTYFSGAVNFVFLLLLLSLFYYPSLYLYLFILLLRNIVFLIGFLYLARKHISVTYVLPSDVRSLIQNAFFKFSFWDHMAGSVTDVIYRADILILSFFAATQTIADYTIALTLSASLLFVLPSILQKSSMAAFARITEKSSLDRALSLFLRYSLFISLIQLLVTFFISNALIALFTNQNANSIQLIFILLAIAASIFNWIRPFHSFALARANVKLLFFKVYLPAGLFALGVYVAFGFFGSAVGMAFANIVVYTVLGCLLAFYVLQACKPKLTWFWITEHELSLIRSFWNKLVHP